MVEMQQTAAERPDSSDELGQLQARIADLRAQPAPSSELIDALNAQAHLLSREDVGRALALSKEAYTLARLLQHHNGIGISLARLSWLHLNEGLFDAAVMEAHEARFLAERLNDYVLVTRAIYVLAVAERMAGSVPRAEALWRELLAMARVQGDRGREADYLNELGVLFVGAGENAKALAHYEMAHLAHVALDDIHHIHDKNNIADVLVRLGRAGEALPWVEQALAGCDPQWQAWRAQFLHTAGVVHMHTGSLAQARRFYDESHAISSSSAGSKETAVSALLDLGRLALISSKLHDAISQFEAALTLAAEIKSLPQLREAHKMLHRLYRSSRSEALANVHHEAMVQLDHQINTTRMSRHMALFRIEAELDKHRLAWSQELMLMRPAPH